VNIEPRTAQGQAGLEALIADPRHALVAFDYDGTLADIVADPADARPHPDVVAGLVALSARVGLVAIVTGRPAAQAVELGRFESAQGLERLVVLGHYGVERWDAATSSLQTTRTAGLTRPRRRRCRGQGTLGRGTRSPAARPGRRVREDRAATA
jgi:hypothetical protein